MDTICCVALIPRQEPVDRLLLESQLRETRSWSTCQPQSCMDFKRVCFHSAHGSTGHLLLLQVQLDPGAHMVLSGIHLPFVAWLSSLIGFIFGLASYGSRDNHTTFTFQFVIPEKERTLSHKAPGRTGVGHVPITEPIRVVRE